MPKVNGNMRNAFCRLSKYNHLTEDNKKLGLKAGDTFIYTKEDLLISLESWSKSKKIKYYLIEHNESEENLHYHLVLEFPNNSQCRFSTLKNKFPYGNIEPCGNVRTCVQYLVHMNHPEKKQYEWAEVKTNAPHKLEEYKLPGALSDNVKLKKLVERIIAGELKQYQIEEIDSDVYVKYQSKIKAAFEYRQKLVLKETNRNINIIVLQGPPRVGKSTFCKVYAKEKGKQICFSSSSNDFLQDYMGQEILCIDDMNFDNIPITDLLKILDPHSNTSIKSRYHNKLFSGETIFICTNIPIIKWYPDEDLILKRALFERITYVLDFQWLKYEGGPDMPLTDGKAEYTINKIKNIKEITTGYKLEYSKLKKTDDWTLISIDDDQVHIFDLTKYIDLTRDEKAGEDFLQEIKGI